MEVVGSVIVIVCSGGGSKIRFSSTSSEHLVEVPESESKFADEDDDDSMW